MELSRLGQGPNPEVTQRRVLTMETSNGGRRTLAQSIAHWQSVVLVGLSVAGGLTLTVMVIGSAPTAPAQASAVEVSVEPELVAAAADVPDPPAVAEVSAETTDLAATGATDAALDGTAVSGETTPAQPAAQVPATPAPVPVAAPAPASAPLPLPATPLPVAAPAAAPAATPTAPAPTAPAPTTPAPTTAAPTSAPTTAAPATAAPTTVAPTTAAPTTAPTTAALSYPTYAVSGIGSVGLQFDGSRIFVASVSPERNWVYEIDRNGPRSVEVKFFNVATEREGEFHAELEGGRIKVES